MFMIVNVFIIKTTRRAQKMCCVDTHRRQISKALSRETPRIMRGVWSGPTVFVSQLATFLQMVSQITIHLHLLLYEVLLPI